MQNPVDLKYSMEHEWLAEDGTVGITSYAVEQIGDIVFVEVPSIGTEVEAGLPFGVIESVKAVSELFAPATGRVVAVNEALEEHPEAVAEDCYGAGWLVRIKVTDPGSTSGLMGADDYQSMIDKS